MVEKEFAEIRQKMLKIEKLLNEQKDLAPENRFWEIVCQIIPVIEKIVEMIPDTMMIAKIILEALVKLLKEICRKQGQG